MKMIDVTYNTNDLMEMVDKIATQDMVDDSSPGYEKESYNELMNTSLKMSHKKKQGVILEVVLVKITLNFLLKLQKKIVVNAWKNIKYKMIFPIL
jgi:hypothetical protein